MLKKYSAIFFHTALLIIQSGCDDSSKKIFKEFNQYATKSIAIELYFSKHPNPRSATGILVQKNGQLYLATNFHCVPGKSFIDSTHFKNDGDGQTKRLVAWIPAKNYQTIAYTIDLTKTPYIPIPAIENIYIGNIFNPNTVTDLIFIPLSITDPNAIVDTTEIFDSQPDIDIKPNTEFSIWGFLNGRAKNKVIAGVDLVKSVSNRLGSTKNYHIYFDSPVLLPGDSGAPVYIKNGKNLLFIGIHSAVGQSYALKHPSEHENIGIIISKAAIRFALEHYVH